MLHLQKNTTITARIQCLIKFSLIFLNVGHFFQVHKQHLERTLSFLVDELKVVQGPQAEQRVFFVSAKETLQQRLNEAKGQPNNSKCNHELLVGRFSSGLLLLLCLRTFITQETAKYTKINANHVML